MEPPYRYVRANAQGAKSRYLRILVTDDVIGKYDNPFLCIKEIEFNKNIEENTSTYPIASSAEGNLENVSIRICPLYLQQKTKLPDGWNIN